MRILSLLIAVTLLTSCTMFHTRYGMAGRDAVAVDSVLNEHGFNAQVAGKRVDITLNNSQYADVKGQPRAVPSRNAASGSAWAFNGTDDYLHVPGIPVTTARSDAMMIETLLRAESLDGRRLVAEACNPGCAAGSFALYLDEGRPVLEVVDTLGKRHDIAAGQRLSAKSWHHLAAGRSESGHFQLYADGRCLADSALALGQVPDLQGGASLAIAGASNERFSFFHGALDELRVWRRAIGPTILSPAPLQPTLSNAADLLSYWNFNEAPRSRMYGTGRNVTVTGIDLRLQSDTLHWIGSYRPRRDRDADPGVGSANRFHRERIVGMEYTEHAGIGGVLLSIGAGTLIAGGIGGILWLFNRENNNSLIDLVPLIFAFGGFLLGAVAGIFARHKHTIGFKDSYRP